MSAVFADTFYFLALFNHKDQGHVRAVNFTDHFDGDIVTSAWVLVETANTLAKSKRRPEAGHYVRELFTAPEFEVAEASPELLRRGLNLYLQRPDKQWSLTDCISFVVMRERGLTDALTEDHHFEQAGFKAVFR